MNYYKFLTLFIIISIIFFLIIPIDFFQIQKLFAKESLKSDSFLYKLKTNTFSYVLNKTNDISKINIKSLEKLEKILNLNLSELKTRLNENNGIYWSVPIKKIVISEINIRLNEKIFLAYIKTFNLEGILILTGLILLLVLYFTMNKKSQFGGESPVLSLILIFIIFSGLITFYVVHYPELTKIFKEKISNSIPIENFTHYLLFRKIVLFIEIGFLFLIIIFLALKKFKSDSIAFLWFIPSIFLLININSLPYNLRISKQTYKSNQIRKQENNIKVTLECYLAAIRQQNKTNLIKNISLTNLKVPVNYKNATYQINIFGNLYELKAVSKEKRDFKHFIFKIKYDSVKDKILSENEIYDFYSEKNLKNSF